MRGYELCDKSDDNGEFWFRIPMRGYEIPNKRKSACRYAFRIPMRGYERIMSGLSWSRRLVPNPHEGL